MGKRQRKPRSRRDTPSGDTTTRWFQTTAAQRTALAAAVMLVIVAAVLRLAWLDRATVEHFDEGVYASKIWFPPEDGSDYPARHLYAPPLMPILTYWSLAFGGQFPATAPLLPNLLAGIATVVAVGWVAARWFNVRVGVLAGILTATSESHILFSRSALTDVVLVLSVVLAVAGLAECLRRPGWGWVLFAGTATGIAWWTKYNGWLPLAIGLAGGGAWWCLESRDPKAGKSAALGWIGVVVVAVLLWLPVLWQLQDHGGYSAVAANHRQYVVGAGGWAASFARQAHNFRQLDGVISWTGLAIAIGAAGIWLMRQPRVGGLGGSSCGSVVAAIDAESATSRAGGKVEANQATSVSGGAGGAADEEGERSASPDAATITPSWNGLLAVGGLVAAATAIGLTFSTTAALCTFSIVGIAASLFRRRRDSAAANLPVWLLAAWWIGLLIATPFYAPYPRLTLPWLAASWLAAALGLETIFSWWLARCTGGGLTNTKRSSVVSWSGSTVLIVVSLVVVGGYLATGRLNSRATRLSAWQQRTDWQRLATDLAAQSRRLVREEYGPSFPESVIYVFGEPALFYHLRAEGLRAVGPVASLDFATAPPTVADIPVLLVVGPHARRTAKFQETWPRFQHYFRFDRELTYTASQLVLLNNPDFSRSEPVQVYRLITPPAESGE